MKKPKTFQLSLRVLLLLFVPIALATLFSVDRYRHALERRDALASLSEIGLNHEFDSAKPSQTQVSFYSTTSHFNPVDTKNILRHLKTISRDYNNLFRFCYDIEQVDFKNAELDVKLIEELHVAFPSLKVSGHTPQR